jgi:spermidine/putrescine transport system ATP-binding protein
VPPHQRNVNTVFQSYALFPHLDVAKNVAFGLKYQKLDKAERAKRVGEALELVSMTEFATRKADQLSGGQQQRVALARALVLRPQVLLLDEPLGALDAQLRKNLQVELKALQAELGVTFVFVTHDQGEALTMSDRIAVMNRGRVEQAAPPKAIYEAPETVFVADFLGVSNLLGAEAVGQDGGACTVRVGDRTLRAQEGATTARGEVKVMIRPERIVIEPHASSGEQRMPGIVERAVFQGGAYEVHIRVLGGELLRAMVPNDGEVSPSALEAGAAVSLHLPADALRVLTPSEDGEAPAEDSEAGVSPAGAPPHPITPPPA